MNKLNKSQVNINNLVTVRHYAERLGIASETVRQRIKKGEIPYIKIDGVYFVITHDYGCRKDK